MSSTILDTGGAPAPHVIVVTGMSGAGRSHAANVLEDLGYFVVDNLPPGLIVDVVDRVGTVEGDRPLTALVVDTRGGVTATELDAAVQGLRSRGIRTTVLFLDADDPALAKRFEETRRSHPINAASLIASIAAERKAFEDIRGMSDIIIDTSELSVHDLRRRIEGAFTDIDDRGRMRVDIMSFGFKRGVPRIVDLMFDVRFLPNPHWVPELRPLTGLDPAVRDYVLETVEAKGFIDKMMAMVDYLLPLYAAEGKKYLTIGIGCTGGQHRSVAIARALADHLEGGSLEVSLSHRELPEVSVER